MTAIMRPARSASRLGVHIAVLVLFIASCIPPYQPGTCTYAPPSSSGGPDYSDAQNVDITKWGRTRDEAGIAAIDACSDLLYLSANATISPGSLVLEECRVLKCSR